MIRLYLKFPQNFIRLILWTDSGLWIIIIIIIIASFSHHF